jgi:hypothetical protein
MKGAYFIVVNSIKAKKSNVFYLLVVAPQACGLLLPGINYGHMP